MEEIILITPPFTQLNTPYPATAYLKGFLNTKGIASYQMDLGIEVINELFSKKGLKNLFDVVTKNQDLSPNAKKIILQKEEYIKKIEPVISFLQGKNPTIAQLISSENFLPKASRFGEIVDVEWSFGEMGIHDKTKYLATLFLDDLADFIKEVVDPNFGFSRYAERLAMSANSFDELYNELHKEPTYIDELSFKILKNKIGKSKLKLVCFSVPFPGNLYSALRCAQFLKSIFPNVKIAMGGGYPNTELRELKETRVFEFVDFITLDDGELPIELLIKHVFEGENEFKRTFRLESGVINYISNTKQTDYKFSQTGTPNYSDLPLDKYISVIEMVNPMHSLWSNGRWNKLTMAHGCYWAKCTFCDISLDYISLYEPLAAKEIVDKMESLIQQTGETGFHFVDEAAPPSLMKEVAIEILRRELVVSWWTNIRFEKSFTKDLCKLLKASGCIAVTGGLEVASDRLLKLIDKGITIEQVAKVLENFTDAQIMVHAYLMYGYPTQTEQETIDSLEMVRQMFELGILQSAFWHQFAMTAHSPIGKNPSSYGLTPRLNETTFAKNDIDFKDQTGVDHSKFSFGLKKAIYNYMYGIGFDFKLKDWFNFKTPKTTISPYHIEDCLATPQDNFPKPNHKLIWTGNFHHNKELKEITVIHNGQEQSITLPEKTISFLANQLDLMKQNPIKFKEFQQVYDEQGLGNFQLFWFSQELEDLREMGLLTV